LSPEEKNEDGDDTKYVGEGEPKQDLETHVEEEVPK
jgi:hypothetical protein